VLRKRVNGTVVIETQHFSAPAVYQFLAFPFFVAKIFKISITVILLLFLGDVSAEGVEEYRVKAALVLNFARFTEWPVSTINIDSKQSIHFCVIGNSEVEEAFAEIDNKSVGEWHVEIRNIDDLPELKNCHLVYVGYSEKRRLPEVFAAIEDQPVLTIGEMDEFTSLGGMINLVIQERKIGFQVNLDAANNANLRISARVLKLGDIVKGDPGKMGITQ